MFNFLQKKMVKYIHNKGTINVSGVWSKTIFLPLFLDPSLREPINKKIKF